MYYRSAPCFPHFRPYRSAWERISNKHYIRGSDLPPDTTAPVFAYLGTKKEQPCRKYVGCAVPPSLPFCSPPLLAFNATSNQFVVCVSTTTIIQGAKEDSDAFLTELINQELAQKVDGGGGKQANAQCPSGESKGAAAAVAEGGQRDSGDPEPMELEPCSSSGGAASPVQKGDPVVRERFHACT